MIYSGVALYLKPEKYIAREIKAMKNLFSLFLSQSYQDCWDDYNRSIKSSTFPQWELSVR